ncbi:Putative acetyltransferase SA2342 [Ewingella americana]|uniref:Acetyltransferase SA2342 n=1 Tax=Ewingella americana TaxID=41202 RepID=A0A377NFX2_9GAMM|nr:Putative acetyltransferase SA2342 [Ewingella americana]
MHLKSYSDNSSNAIDYTGITDEKTKVLFFGKNNKLFVHPEAKITGTTIRFDCDDGICHIGRNFFSGLIRIGQGCTVSIGNDVTCTGGCYISTAENTSITIGNDCMIASGNEIRSDDGHPIFDIATGERINKSRSILISDHVWLAARSIILSGSTIGEGSVIGLGSIVKGTIPNNSIAVGDSCQNNQEKYCLGKTALNIIQAFLKA